MTKLDLARLQQVREYGRSGKARRIRESAGLSCAEVAAAIGVTASAVAHWESGRRVPRGSNAMSYWKVLDELLAMNARAEA